VSAPNGEVAFGDYLLEQRLSAGTSCEVWRARHLDPSVVPSKVVLERLGPGLARDHARVAQLRARAELLRRLAHPAIEALVDEGDVGGEPFIATAFVEGLSLRDCLSRNLQGMRASSAASVIADACAALDLAHRSGDGTSVGVLHRELSPEAILVGTDGGVRVLGFKPATEPAISRETRLAAYTAPELLDGTREASPASDVYGLGVVLFELCTGLSPFHDCVETAEVVRAATTVGVPPASRLRSVLPPELVRIISAATRRRPSERLDSAAALETRLRRFLKTYPAPSPRELGERVRAWARAPPVAKVGDGSAGLRSSLETDKAAEPDIDRTMINLRVAPAPRDESTVSARARDFWGEAEHTTAVNNRLAEAGAGDKAPPTPGGGSDSDSDKALENRPTARRREGQEAGPDDRTLDDRLGSPSGKGGKAPRPTRGGRGS
jgi:serine/threonine protein kinase